MATSLPVLPPPPPPLLKPPPPPPPPYALSTGSEREAFINDTAAGACSCCTSGGDTYENWPLRCSERPAGASSEASGRRRERWCFWNGRAACLLSPAGSPATLDRDAMDVARQRSVRVRGEAEASDVLVTFYSETHLCGTTDHPQTSKLPTDMSCLVGPRRFVRRGSRGARRGARVWAQYGCTAAPNGAFTTCSCSSVAWRTLALAIYCHRQARERVSRHTRCPPPHLAHPQFSINCSRTR